MNVLTVPVIRLRIVYDGKKYRKKYKLYAIRLHLFRVRGRKRCVWVLLFFVSFFCLLGIIRRVYMRIRMYIKYAALKT